LLRIANGDVYAVFPARHGGGFTASIGRTVTGLRWPDPESAKAGLFDIVREAGPERLAALHAGEDRPARDRREPAPRDAPAGDDQAEPETLLSLPRPFLWARFGRNASAVVSVK
jgi:hypothetical protein